MLVKFFQLNLSDIIRFMHDKLESEYQVLEKSLLDLKYLHFSTIVVCYSALFHWENSQMRKYNTFWRMFRQSISTRLISWFRELKW